MKRMLCFSLLAAASISAFAHPARSTVSDNVCVNNIAEHIDDNSAYFYNCKLQDTDVWPLLKLLNQKYPSVNDINVESNNLSADGAAEFSNSGIVKIKILNIQNNHIGDDGAVELAKNATIEQLDVSGNNIGDAGALALSKSEAIKELAISDNNLTPRGVLALAYDKSLTELELQKTTQDDLSLYALGGSDLEYLDISYSNIHNKDLSYFSKSPSLKAISVVGNRLNASGISALAVNKNLIGIMANENLIGDEGAIALSGNDFVYLGLGHNKITDVGANALANNKHLQILFLEDNEIANNGATALASLPNLDTLLLANNHIGDEGVTSLAKNPALIFLSVGSNNIHNDGAFALANNTGELSFLDVSYNYIGVEGIKALENNPKLAGHLYAEGNLSNKIKPSRLKHIAMIKSYCAKMKNAFCKKVF